MGVAAQIAQHLHGPTEGGLGIDHPVVAVQAAHESSELLRIREGGGGSVATQLVAAVQTFQTGDELAAKDAARDNQSRTGPRRIQSSGGSLAR